MILDRSILTLCLTLSFLEATAQPMFYFRNLDVNDGLPNNYVSSFCEDDQGFMWIGTRDGLVRYDGVSFETHYHDPADTNSIAGNNIAQQMFQDAEGRLWIPVRGKGLSRYDPRTNSFTNFTHYNGRLPFTWTRNAERVIADKTGLVYVICGRGVVTVDQHDKVSTLINLESAPDALKRTVIRFATVHNDRWLWMATRDGIACFDLELDTWRYSDVKNKDLYFSPQRASHGVAASAGKLWFSTYFPPSKTEARLLFSLDLESLLLDSVPIAPQLEKEHVQSDQTHIILIDRKGMLWLGTDRTGLLKFDPKNRTWTHYRGGSDWQGDLLPSPLRQLYESSTGDLWIGTENGLSLMAPRRQYFENYAEVSNGPGTTISLEEIRNMAIGPKDEVWLGKLGNGLLQLNANKELQAQWKGLPTTAGEFRDHLDPRLAFGDTLIFSGWYSGLFALDHRTGKVFSYAPVSDKGHQDKLMDVFQHSSGDLYGIGWDRVGLLDPKTGRFDQKHTLKTPAGDRDLAWSATEDDDGNIWFGLERMGLLGIDPSTNNLIGSWYRDTTAYLRTPVWQQVNRDGRIYLPLDGEGLGIYNIATGQVEQFTKKDGLCTDDVTGVLKDATGDVWIYSASGISCFNESEGSFKTFTEAEGMISETVKDAALLSTGNILMITDRGLVEFNPQQLKELDGPDRPSLRSIQVYDQTINIAEWVQDSSMVEVPYDKNYLRVEFSALEFFDPEKIQFAYRLEGAEERWNYTDHRPVAIYTNIGGGEYRLCVKRTNVDGVWGPEVCVPVFVTTPFYQEAWFFMLLALVLIGITFFIYRWQLHRKMAVLKVRDRLSRDLHDDIGSALSSINIYSSVAQQQLEEDKEEARRSLERIGSSAENMMQNMDDIVWAIDPKNDELSQLSSRMLEFAGPVLEAKSIELKFEFDQALSRTKLDMQSRRNLFLIFKEAVNNIAKYSEAKLAEITLRRMGNNIQMTLTDNGKGFDPSASSDRHGLKNMKIRAIELGGSARISSSENEGTTVSVHIPIT